MSRDGKPSKPAAIVQHPNLVQIGYLCRRVMNASLDILQAHVPDLDVTAGQMGTLVLIACNPGITPTDICRAQDREKSTITTSLDHLARKKLITRRLSSSDRRSFSLYLTKAGRDLYESISPKARLADRQLTRCLTREERKTLHDLLVRIYKAECNGQSRNERRAKSARKP